MRSVLLRTTLVLLTLAGAAFAQRDLATILGTVTDTSGAVIAGAQVTVTNQDTGAAYALESNEEGVYIRPALQPGNYTVEVETTGFKKAVQQNVRLTSGDRIQLNVALELGEVTETIEVTTAPPALQTESTIIGAQLESKTVRELPLGGQRKFSFLARLSPAVVPAEPGARDAAGGGFSANGVRSNGQNNFLLKRCRQQRKHYRLHQSDRLRHRPLGRGDR